MFLRVLLKIAPAGLDKFLAEANSMKTFLDIFGV